MQKRYDIPEDLIEVLVEVRDKFKDADVGTEQYDTGYQDGVIDALSFVWAGLPKDAAQTYGPVMSAFARLLEKAGV